MNHNAIDRAAITTKVPVLSRMLPAIGVVLSLVLAGCANWRTQPRAVFRGVAPSGDAVILSLQQLQTHFKRSIFATLRVHGHRINLVGQWITTPSPYFNFVALTELGTLAVQLQRLKGHTIIRHIAAEFPQTLAIALGNDLYMALAAPAVAARSSPVISLHRHDAQIRVTGSGNWHGALYFAGTAGHLALTRLTSKAGRVIIRYSRYHKSFQPGRLTILDTGHGLEMTLDFTGDVP